MWRKSKNHFRRTEDNKVSVEQMVNDHSFIQYGRILRLAVNEQKTLGVQNIDRMYVEQTSQQLQCQILILSKLNVSQCTGKQHFRITQLIRKSLIEATCRNLSTNASLQFVFFALGLCVYLSVFSTLFRVFCRLTVQLFYGNFSTVTLPCYSVDLHYAISVVGCAICVDGKLQTNK